ncbi:MAG: pyrroline-5-carboxylate reductase [Nitrosomonas sp.]|nr:MAG: pyrroline-5-carboxylate reductase [Nitrosomonas sp.]
MNITFVGGGNMASALLSGLLRQGNAAERLCVVEINPESRERLGNELGIRVVASLADGIESCNVIVLAVKPQQLHELALVLAPLLSDQLIVSIAAGIRTADLKRWLGGYVRVVRAMPNTPSLVRCGVTGLYAAPYVNNKDRDSVERILSAVGTILWVEDEESLHAITAISGSGPAYVFYFMEAMQQAAVEFGLTPSQARQLSLDTFIGASELARASNDDAAMLRARVTSKGGTTEQAILSMEKNEIKCKITAAIRAAYIRSHTMSDELGKNEAE